MFVLQVQPENPANCNIMIKSGQRERELIVIVRKFDKQQRCEDKVIKNNEEAIKELCWLWLCFVEGWLAVSWIMTLLVVCVCMCNVCLVLALAALYSSFSRLSQNTRHHWFCNSCNSSSLSGFFFFFSLPSYRNLKCSKKEKITVETHQPQNLFSSFVRLFISRNSLFRFSMSVSIPERKVKKGLQRNLAIHEIDMRSLFLFL